MINCNNWSLDAGRWFTLCKVPFLSGGLRILFICSNSRNWYKTGDSSSQQVRTREEGDHPSVAARAGRLLSWQLRLWFKKGVENTSPDISPETQTQFSESRDVKIGSRCSSPHFLPPSFLLTPGWGRLIKTSSTARRGRDTLHLASQTLMLPIWLTSLGLTLRHFTRSLNSAHVTMGVISLVMSARASAEPAGSRARVRLGIILSTMRVWVRGHPRHYTRLLGHYFAGAGSDNI